MHLWRSVLMAVLVVGFGLLTACGGDSQGGSDGEDSPVALGVRREVPQEDPCQWLTLDETTAALESAGADIGSSGLYTVTDAPDLGDLGTSCWYGSRAGGKDHLSVALLATAETAESWQERMQELADQGGSEVDGDVTRTLTRVADAPGLRLSRVGDGSAGCDVFALLGEAAVVSVSLSADGAADTDAMCAASEGAIEMVIGRLPEAE